MANKKILWRMSVEGRLVMEEVGAIEHPAALLIDRAYADRKTLSINYVNTPQGGILDV
jgi:hypothetical protein